VLITILILSLFTFVCDSEIESEQLQLTSAARGAIPAATRPGKPHIRATTIADVTID